MSIVINGMDMPKTCVGCVLERGGYCEGFEIPRAIKFKTDHITRMDWCPLIELPPHGWLIDREKMLDAIRLELAQAEACEDMEDYESWLQIFDFVRKFPIIPADKEDT